MPTRKSLKRATGTKATGATVSAKGLASLEEVASEGTGEDGGAEVVFKESGFIKPEMMSCEDESGKIKSSMDGNLGETRGMAGLPSLISTPTHFHGETV
jgi:hypothetical protein